MKVSFLSTLPARGATDIRDDFFQSSPISIHAPREGSDVEGLVTSIPQLVFLSTLPARGATWPKGVRPQGRFHFYPRSPRGERRTGFWL